MLRQAIQATLILRDEVTAGLMIHGFSCFEHKQSMLPFCENLGLTQHLPESPGVYRLRRSVRVGDGGGPAPAWSDPRR